MGLRSLSLPYVRSGNPVWFRHLVKDDSKCMDTLFEVQVARSYWVNDDVLRYLGKLRNLQSIEMDRLYDVSAEGLSYLFDDDRETVMKNIHLTRGMKSEYGTIEFMKLMIKNGGQMMQFDFSECEGVMECCSCWKIRRHCLI